jgi:hypothetical protein
MRFRLVVLNFLQLWIYLAARLFRISCFEFRILIRRKERNKQEANDKERIERKEIFV